MTNLTEQCEQGTLPDGSYYVRLNNDTVTIDVYDCGEWWSDKYWDEITEVLAEVPTYDEWQTAKKMIAQSIGVCDENIKLKKLLKELIEKMDDVFDGRFGVWIKSIRVDDEFIAKIDQVLQEQGYDRE